MTETDQVKPAPERLLKQAHHRITARLRKLQNELEGIGETDHATERSFHSTRVLTRKIQAGLSAFKPLIRKKTRRTIQTQIKEIRRSASEVRDLDVCLELLKESSPRASPQAALAISHLTSTLENARSGILARFQQTCHDAGISPKWDKMRKQLGKDFRHNHEEEAKGDFGLEAIRQSWQTLLDAYEIFKTEGQADEDLHDLRKKVKRFRYTVEFFPSSLTKQDRREIMRSCKKVQDALGRVTDVLMLRQVAFKEELKLRRGNPELRISFTHFHHFLDQEELTARDDFWSVWDKHFVPIGHLTGKAWPTPLPGSGQWPDGSRH